MDIKDIEHIIKILKQNEVTEFELEQEGTRVKLARTPAGGFVQAESRMELVPVVHNIAIQPQLAQSSNAASEELGRFVKVESPIVGSFYRRPSPDAEPFVKEGDVISKGGTLCIVEAMKLMNEIESPTSGKVVKILGTEGQVVEFGEVLFLIDPAV
jgi:acetyl-CoA carboxylase biotin carboxyl carrier protein